MVEPRILPISTPKYRLFRDFCARGTHQPMQNAKPDHGCRVARWRFASRRRDMGIEAPDELIGRTPSAPVHSLRRRRGTPQLLTASVSRYSPGSLYSVESRKPAGNYGFFEGDWESLSPRNLARINLHAGARLQSATRCSCVIIAGCASGSFRLRLIRSLKQRWA